MLEVIKWSWRGPRLRLIKLTESSLSTYDPADQRLTNEWPILDILSVEQRGNSVRLRLGGKCACGLDALFSQLNVSLPDTESAAALLQAVRTRLSHSLTRESSAANQAIMLAEQLTQVAETHPLGPLSERSSGAPSPLASPLASPRLPQRGPDGLPAAPPSIPAIPSPSALVPVPLTKTVSAPLPGELSTPMAAVALAEASLASQPPSPKQPDGPMEFEVCVTINKARGLPVPPIIYSNPIVECVWGAPQPGKPAEDLTPALVAASPEGRAAAAAAAAAAGGAELSGLGLSAVGDPWDIGEAPGGFGAFGGGGGGGGGGMGGGEAASGAPVLFSTDPAHNDAANPCAVSAALKTPPLPACPDQSGLPCASAASAQSATHSRVPFVTPPPFAGCLRRWSHESCFRYGATPAQLQSRCLLVRVTHTRPLLPRAEAGRTLVCLYDIAVGPMKFDMPLTGDAALLWNLR